VGSLDKICNAMSRQQQQCPKCGREGKLLVHSSGDVIKCYRCDPCHHVWCNDSTDRAEMSGDVNMRPRDRDDVSMKT